MTLYPYLALGLVLFCIGLFGVLTRRNIIGILMSIELMFNAANINFVAVNHFLFPHRLWGEAVTLFNITIAASEIVVGLALVLAIYRNLGTVYVEKFDILKG